MPFVFLLAAIALPTTVLGDTRSLACREVADGWHVARFLDGASVGGPIRSRSDCTAAVEAARNGVVCVPRGGKWMARHVDRLHWVGRYPIAFDACLESTRRSGHGVVCSATGVDLSGKPGFKPTDVEKPDDSGFLGSSAWLEYCVIATFRARDGTVCANGGGGTGNHAQWYRHVVATKAIVAGARPQTVEACAGPEPDDALPRDAGNARDDGFQILPSATLAKYRAMVPPVADTEVDDTILSPDTVWYDATAIVPGYQDSMGSPVGFRPNTIDADLINTAVPGGWQRLFERKGRFHFPFATGGADRSDNFVKFNFFRLPRRNGALLPVVYTRLSWSRWQWLFPVGTVLGEVLAVRFTDGSLKVFELRTRHRHLDRWENRVFRPFPTSDDLAYAVRERRPDWYLRPNLFTYVEHLRSPNTLEPARLQTRFFPGTFTTQDGHLDVLPDLGDPELAKELLSDRVFRPVDRTPWKTAGSARTYAASTNSRDNVVPRFYDGGLIEVNDESCRRCHQDAGRAIGEFYPELVLYGELWGEDETFSWHPFETRAFVNPNGEVANFNDDNRRLRPDFVSAGIVKPFQASQHPSTIYKALPRSWTYRPVRTSSYRDYFVPGR
jgi:hypothetical protein